MRLASAAAQLPQGESADYFRLNAFDSKEIGSSNAKLTNHWRREIGELSERAVASHHTFPK
jgi:hypothetical protein